MRRFEGSVAIEIRDGITFDFYTGLPHIYMASFGGIFEISGWSVRWQSSHILVSVFVCECLISAFEVATCNSIRMPPNAWDAFAMVVLFL